MDLLIDFRDTRVFEGALNYPAILIGQRGAGTAGEMEAARIFSSETPLSELLNEFRRLRKKVADENVQRGNAVEVFRFPRNQLKAEGWWLMPQQERRVFDRFRDCEGQSLNELTASASGGFAGYQTSADAVLVFDEVEDCGQILKLAPRHEPKHCGCGKNPVEIEKEALRPFLFGKDVTRWLIDWKKTWVMFPYDTYQKKETLYDEMSIVEGWNLIPSGQNIDRFNFANPDAIATMEERFPKAWKYLRNHEEVLRKRENDKYAKDKVEGYGWYGATYPRALEYYFRPKLVLQVLSRGPSVAFDQGGGFVFTAGGTAGVYGIALRTSSPADLKSVAALLNSRAVDFQVKQVSSVFGSRFYSYGDQFIEKIVLPTHSSKFASAGPIADALVSLTALRVRSVHKLRGFPESFVNDLSKYELDTVKRLCDKQPQSESLKIIPDAIRVERALYGFEVHYGNQAPFEFKVREHAECVAEALRNHKRQNIRRKEVLSWRLPVRAAGCKKLLELLARLQDDLAQLKSQVASAEENLNELVFEMYGVSKDEQKVIDDFLTRYSSTSIAAVAEELENETPEAIDDVDV